MNCSRTWASTGASTTTDCSDAQIVPLSKQVLNRISETAFSIFAERSIKAGTFPGPTPNAGLPDEYAARTKPVPPVARITAVLRCFIKVSVPSIVEVVRQIIASPGNPALIAASRITRAVSPIHFAADGCGERTIVLRDFIAMIILYIAVDVGLVEGMIAATTPRGLAISTMLSVSLTTPTVLRSRK